MNALALTEAPVVNPTYQLDASAKELLLAMLSYRRPHGSRAEQRFIRRFIEPLGATKDDFGNLYVQVGDSPKILWSSHVDTVHNSQGRQRVIVDSNNYVKTDGSSNSNCLGADCTTGVWLMVQMIKAGKPGLYIFHRGEEEGCLGSRWIAEHNKAALSGIDYAVAFDRYGFDSVITHQMYGQCCSDRFAVALCDQLGPGFRPDPHGSYTDTNEYIPIIPECTNLSVGYFNQHTRHESQSLDFLAYLLPALLAIDVDKLPVSRDPDGYYYDQYQTSAFQSAGDSVDAMRALVEANPELVAEILHEYGFSTTDVADEIYARCGVVPIDPSY